MLRPATGSTGWRRRRGGRTCGWRASIGRSARGCCCFPAGGGRRWRSCRSAGPIPSPWYLALFFAGAFLMRGAGCTYNDIVDRDYDASVARTAARPIPSGQVSVARGADVPRRAVPRRARRSCSSSTCSPSCSAPPRSLLVAIYPFMKRFTYWPQLVLGLTFKWGALVGWAAVTGSLSLAPVVLYAGCVLWTIGYDTIYAHQDKEDDLAIGLKSTALRFGDATPRWLVGFYAGAVLLWAVAGALAGARLAFFLALGACRACSSPGRWRRSTWPTPAIASPASSPISWSAGCCSWGLRPTWRLAALARRPLRRQALNGRRRQERTRGDTGLLPVSPRAHARVLLTPEPSARGLAGRTLPQKASDTLKRRE